MEEFKFDTQLLLDGSDLDEDEIHDYIMVHFHTNQPWQVLEYMASLGDIYDVVIENMDRQARGLRG